MLVLYSICLITGKVERIVNESREVTISFYEREMKIGKKKCSEELWKIFERAEVFKLIVWLVNCCKENVEKIK